jgi:hypothetical protein
MRSLMSESAKRNRIIEMTLSLLRANDKPRALARKTLDIMTHHRDLACVREPNDLAKQPQGEWKEWQAFWAEVAMLLKKAGSS